MKCINYDMNKNVDTCIPTYKFHGKTLGDGNS